MASEWQRHEVKALIEDEILLIGDGYRAKNQELASSGLPFARAGNVNNGFRFEDADRFPEAHVARVGNKISQPGDVVFTSKGTVGRFAFVRPDTPRFVYSPQLCFWRSLNKDVIEPRFLYYWMQGREFFIQFKGVAGQTDMAEYVSLSDQRRMHITLPPIADQRAIAHILGTLDDKIELNRKQNETLEAMARALFKAWFVDFEPVRAKMEGRWQRGQSLPGLPTHLYDLFPDRLVESELGEIPEGWEIEELGAHLDVLESGRRPKGGVRGVDKGVPSVGAESITGVGQFEFGKTKYVSEEFFAAMKSGQVESMDVLLYKDGGKPGDFKPRVSMFGRGFPFERFAINEHVFRMRSRSLGQAFLYLQMSDERILFELRSRGGKAAIPGINQADVRTLLVIVPPRELLTTFDKAALPMMEGILDRAIEGRAIAQLRDTLLPKLISGELRIADAEKPMEKFSQ